MNEEEEKVTIEFGMQQRHVWRRSEEAKIRWCRSDDHRHAGGRSAGPVSFLTGMPVQSFGIAAR